MLNNLRDILKPTLEKIGKTFASTGLSPNFWTVVGFVFAIIAALVYGLGLEFGLIIGGILLLVSGFFDMIDGQVARVTGKTSQKGSYLDSMFDKIAEVAIFLGLLVGGYAEPYLVMLAITLSLLVSYARA
ncbi:MAG: CDP-alcohol phosphatidyltransferase family protein, partial [Nitrosarchaeum sp.]|nr:CDP-alcohol phosphatidyltransferase family protein [Nitrosarchaeum sp.]